MSNQVLISQIEVDEDIYPRQTTNPDGIESCRETIRRGEKLPPIIIQKILDGGKKRTILLDGLHRMEASKQEGLSKISTEYWNTKILDKKEHLLELQIEAIRRNLKHGTRLNPDDKKNRCRLMAKDDKDMTLTQKKLADIFHVSQATISSWIADIRAGQVQKRNTLIMEMKDRGKTQNEIAKYIGLGQSEVAVIIKKIGNDKINKEQKDKLAADKVGKVLFELMDKKENILKVISAWSIPVGDNETLVSPLHITPSIDKQSLECNTLDKTGTILIIGKWTPMTVDWKDMTELNINDVVGMFTIINSMDDDMVRIFYTSTNRLIANPAKPRPEEGYGGVEILNILNVKTNRIAAWMEVEMKRNPKPLLEIPKFKKFIVEVDIESEQLRNLLERIKDLDKIDLVANDNKLSFIGSKSKALNIIMSVDTSIKHFSEEKQASSRFSIRILTPLFKNLSGVVKIRMGNDYVLSVQHENKDWRAEYYISFMVDYKNEKVKKTPAPEPPVAPKTPIENLKDGDNSPPSNP